MKYLRPIVVLGLFFALLASLGVGSDSQLARASASVPFHGTFSGTTNVTPCGTATLCLTVTDVGTASLVGRATLDTSVTIHLLPSPCPLPDGTTGGASTFSGSTVVTAANGDTLTLSEEGTACHGANGGTASTTFTISGGTGRFSRATGSGKLEVVDNAAGEETVVLTGTLSFR